MQHAMEVGSRQSVVITKQVLPVDAQSSCSVAHYNSPAVELWEWDKFTYADHLHGQSLIPRGRSRVMEPYHHVRTYTHSNINSVGDSVVLVSRWAVAISVGIAATLTHWFAHLPPCGVITRQVYEACQGSCAWHYDYLLPDCSQFVRGNSLTA